jgi:hypothetical protein
LTLTEYLTELERQNPVADSEGSIKSQEKVSTTDPDATWAVKSGPATLGYDGKEVELGDERLGKLIVVARKPSRRINKNLKHRVPTVESVYKRHPKTVKLLGGKDLSENPQPTVVHKRTQQEVELPARRPVRVAIAFPSWRRRFR